MFLLFAGYDYYPSGGWRDLHSKHDSLEEAGIAGHAYIVNESGEDADNEYYWFHVVDAESQKVVAVEERFHNLEEMN